MDFGNTDACVLHSATYTYRHVFISTNLWCLKYVTNENTYCKT